MKFLCLWAHPDDEVIGAGGTVRLLADLGHEVIVATATDGGAGEGGDPLTLGAVRREELQRSCNILGVKEVRVLDFKDGEMNNQLVWGPLTQTFVELIDAYMPDLVITFDHSGWYFHLDHVGVSIAATVACQQAKHKPTGLLLNLHKPATAGIRWKYVFADKLPATHVVDISRVKDVKIQAMKAHVSQNNPTFLENLETNPHPQEMFQLAFGKVELGIFEVVAVGLEPTTFAMWMQRSANWAKRPR